MVRGQGPETETPIKIGLNIMHNAPFEVASEWWHDADMAGVSVLAVPDSPALLRELYVSTTLCARATSNSLVITGVTNPVTRDPTVTASAVLSLHELAPGRIGLGIGIGDSAAWGVGLKPGTVQNLREYILAVRGLIRGDEVTYQGRRLRLRWASVEDPVQIPIFVACSGPKVTRMAAQVADGIIASMGTGVDNVEYVRQLVSQGAVESGRKPEEVEIYWQSELVFASSPEEGMRKNLGVSVAWLTMGSLEGKQIPDNLKAPLLEFATDVQQLEAAYHDPRRSEILVDRAKKFGVYDWLVARAPGLWGTPDDIVQRFRYLARERGLNQWMLYVGRAEMSRSEHLRLIYDEVLPKLSLA